MSNESGSERVSTDESVTGWLGRLKGGDSLAAQKLWRRYVEQLIRLARKKLGQTPRRAADEEDVVTAAFASFYRGVQASRFSKLDNRDDLWQVLVVLTERKAIDQIRHECADKRGAGEVRGESALEASDLDDLVANEPSPQFAVQVADELERLLDVLGDDSFRRIAIDKMQGYTNQEISARVGISLRSVERRLRLIRRTWNEEGRR